MWLNSLFFLLAAGTVLCYPNWFEKKEFKVGIEYDHSLPMTGGADRYRHRNNYDPFYVSVTARAKSGYVISYLEVSGTIDAGGELDFTLIRGATGATTMTFQLVSNHSDFLYYTYLTYGIREEEYKKLANIISIPMINYGCRLRKNELIIIALFISTLRIYIKNI